MGQAQQRLALIGFRLRCLFSTLTLLIFNIIQLSHILLSDRTPHFLLLHTAFVKNDHYINVNFACTEHLLL